MICAGGDFPWWASPANCPRRRRLARSISNCLSCRWKRTTLARLLRDHRIDVVVNCLGVLQDGPGSDTAVVHCDFVARLLQAIRDSDRAIRLVHISIPGTPESDRTAFSTTKREAERLIAESGVAFTILRPGFVVALAAYGGSAMVRSLAAYPLDLRPPSGPRHSSRSPWRTLPRPSPGLRSAIRRGERRDMGPDAGAAGHAR
jgi:uncharacterized protein YbjT (DUF2867 family)